MDAHITGSELKNKNGAKITINGNEYELVMDFNAIDDIEQKYGDVEIGLNKILEGKISDLKFIFAAMLRHTDDDMTERKAGKLITSDNMQEIFDALGKAMSSSIPESEESKNPIAPQEV